jgi:uncharacterized protein YjbI with pentapeptide repeats
MNDCQFVLSDGKPCGLHAREVGAGGRRCHLHAERGPITALELIANYIGTDRRREIDLSGLQIFGVHFLKSFFPSDRRIIANDCVFDKCEFHGASFANARLRDSHFKNCTFTDDSCDFASAEFSGKGPVFQECKFLLLDWAGGDRSDEKRKLNFQSIHVADSLSLFRACAVTANTVDFGNAALGSGDLRIVLQSHHQNLLILQDLTLNGVSRISFAQMEFRGRLVIEQIGRILPQDVPEFGFYLVNLRQCSQVQFIGLDLSKTNFYGAIIENVLFGDSIWPAEKGYQICYSEVLERRGGMNWKVLLGLYVQLKKNYESAGNYVDGSHWYFREMECRRHLLSVENRNAVLRWLEASVFSLSAMYKYASGYGESYWRPFAWLMGVWFFFALCYDTSGVAYSFDALKLSSAVMMFQTSRLPQPLSFANLAQMLLTLILAPLFLLALRRKFRR